MIAPVVRKLQETLFSIGLFDRVGGIVELQFQGKKKFPVCLAQNCILKKDTCANGYLDFVPNSQYLGVCYFEFVSDNRINDASRLTKLRLVCYWNGEKIETPTHDIIAHILRSVECVDNRISDTIFLNGSCRVASMAKDATVFQKYSYDDSIVQYTKYPFEFHVFDIEFSCRFKFDKLGKIELKQ